VNRARRFLTDARVREPAELRPDDLAAEDEELRRCLGWALEVVDDFADTALDEDEPSQVMLCGGRSIAPADARELCPECLRRIPGCEPGRAAG
jgi:hypothetical protein